MRAILDSFSGELSDLPKGRRNQQEALQVLSKHPRVSAWDLSEHAWVRSLVMGLIGDGLIKADPSEPFPWCRYVLTDAGQKMLRAFLNAPSPQLADDADLGDVAAGIAAAINAMPQTDAQSQIDALKAELQQRALEVMSLDAQNMELAAERDALKAENARLLAANIDGKNWVDAARADIAELSAELAHKQAKIDALMLEFCPGEMTDEQIAEWMKHQVVSDPKAPEVRG